MKITHPWIAVGIVLAAAALVAQYATERKSTALAILVAGLVALSLLAYGIWIRREP